MRRPGFLGDLGDTWFSNLGLVNTIDDFLNIMDRDAALHEMAKKYNRSRGYRGYSLVPPVISDPAYTSSHPLYRAMYVDRAYRKPEWMQYRYAPQYNLYDGGASLSL